ncbi:MAG: HAMP domain-containing protein [Nannocystaceae bacterium]|nr:HAMP domain-containing protein [Nannocystaceae bacterium]
MWTLVRDRLVVKIAVVLVATLLLGFGIPAALNAQLQLTEMERSGHAAAENVAQGLAAGVRTAMLSGNGITARTMIRDARERLSTAELHIYGPNGEEVFGELGPAPPPDALAAHVREVLADGRSRHPSAQTEAIPIENEKRCRGCHAQGDLRGVLTLGTDGARVVLDGGDATLDVLNRISESAFVQIMTAEKEDLLDAYFEELARRVDGIGGVSVLGLEGDVAFGAAVKLDENVLASVYRDGQSRTVTTDSGRLRVLPLANDARCHACHEADDAWRGALVTRVALQLEAPRMAVVTATDVSLRHVMLSGLGRMIIRFLDEVAATGAVSSLTLHDGEGRLFRDAFSAAEAPPAVAAALGSGEAGSVLEHGEGIERFVFVAPLTNDAECIQCHGNDHDVRGAIEVIIDTSESAASRRRLVVTGLVFAVATIVLTLVLLYFGLRALVVRPVAAMGAVADEVANGRLDARVSVRSNDEIGRLGQRLNHMIGEIRKKIELSKFVSKATLGSVDAAESVVRRTGHRDVMTVLFSDIRGFTAYSETVVPEEVVAMLNRYLDAQAEVVDSHGGDIDKFVGDELMAHFHGEGMEARAVECAVEMLAAVERVNAALPEGTTRLQVGIGINAGDVVFGAMGARNRMDFTVIGDAVNLGARLCSIAAGGQVVVSSAIASATKDLVTVECIPLDPVVVKGKREPIEVFEVRRTKAPNSKWERGVPAKTVATKAT